METLKIWYTEYRTIINFLIIIYFDLFFYIEVLKCNPDDGTTIKGKKKKALKYFLAYEPLGLCAINFAFIESFIYFTSYIFKIDKLPYDLYLSIFALFVCIILIQYYKRKYLTISNIAFDMRDVLKYDLEHYLWSISDNMYFMFLGKRWRVRFTKECLKRIMNNITFLYER